MTQSVLGAFAQLNKGVPGVPLHSLDAIADENTRQVLRSIVDGWHVRNGSSGTGDQRFVTASELGSIEGSINGIRRTLNAVQSETKDAIKPGDISRIIYDLQVSIMESALFKKLGERIDLIDLDLVEEQQERIAQAQGLANQIQGVANNLAATSNALAAEAATRLGFDNVQGSKIASLETTTANQATQISGLTTRVGGAESTIINLQTTTATQAQSLTTLTTRTANSESNIVSLQQTTATQATQLNTLSTRAESSESNITSLQQTSATQAQSLTTLTTRVGTAESSITALNTTTATQATQLNSLTTRTTTAESNISTLNTTTANQANSLTSLTTRVANSEAAITSEQTTRANADNAITSNVNTQVSRIDTNVAAIQTQTTTLSNNFASLSSQITTIQASIGANSVAIQQEAQARANKDGLLDAQYTVKIDNNGYVSGFGLASTSNNSTPFSEFIFRADRFSIASPSGPSIAPAIPFIVLTTPQSVNGQTRPAGVYIKDAFLGNGVIDNAKIGDAAIDTLQLAGEAVTIPVYAEGFLSTTVTSSWSADIASASFTVNGLSSFGLARVAVTAALQAYPTDASAANLEFGIFASGTLNTSSTSTISDFGISVTTMGSFMVPNGTHTVSLRVRIADGGASTKGASMLARFISLTAKR
jgi:predicted  nucleic acid-binding Zn-ribbon protein